ncbi:uncharacterized protein PV09_08789 [Verruconis gallopava]|uniref:Rhodopsin domain-containing protein n=1 Tax=Verruconis gallopava TaxID=253628 RepID=A0A0D1ZZZ5_9PEZI|nr:uncharacterized protein PV09_08789 [Verruconis gallopava]KIV99614.1 hypothetical protein PV09_08789 [Verruconis gallopava]
MLTSPSANQILEESVVFGSVGFVLFFGRLWSRAILKQSWKKLQIDDYTMVLTFCCYVVLLVLLNYSCHYSTNEYPPEQLEGILNDPREVQDRIYGSKIVVGLNQAYLVTLWGVKACLLMLYYNMTRDTANNIWVRLVICYTVFGLVVVEISCLFVLCRPFSQYWALPVKNPQCANYFYYCIIQMVFNVSSDFLMLLLPLPFIINARVPLLKRFLLVGIFSLGLFVILAAILNKYYNFTMPNTTVYMVWHIRESSISIYVSNVMCWWPLLRKIFGWKRFLQRGSNIGIFGEPSGNRGSATFDTDNTPLRDLITTTPPPYAFSKEMDGRVDIETGETYIYDGAHHVS